MSDQLSILIEKYKDGVPIKVEGQGIFLLSMATILTVTICVLIIKYIKKQ